MTDDTGAATPTGPASSQRLDKWLWFARVVKTRTLAAGLVTDGRVRVNRERIVKPSQAVRAGDVVTVTVGPHLRVLEVTAPGVRRGPPTEAQALYRDLTPPRERKAEADGTGDIEAAGIPRREPGSGRPTKRDRRVMDRLKPEED